MYGHAKPPAVPEAAPARAGRQSSLVEHGIERGGMSIMSRQDKAQALIAAAFVSLGVPPYTATKVLSGDVLKVRAGDKSSGRESE